MVAPLALPILGGVFELGTKLCRVCLDEKSLSHFHYRSDSQKCRSECKACISKIRKLAYQENSEEIKQERKEYKVSNPVQKLLHSAQSSAKRKGLDFNLEASDILIPDVCPYLGFPLTNIQGEGYIFSNLSIDRVDSSKGYIKGNVQIISRKANTMKNDASAQELITFAQSILRKHNGSTGNSST